MHLYMKKVKKNWYNHNMRRAPCCYSILMSYVQSKYTASPQHEQGSVPTHTNTNKRFIANMYHERKHIAIFLKIFYFCEFVCTHFLLSELSLEILHFSRRIHCAWWLFKILSQNYLLKIFSHDMCQSVRDYQVSRLKFRQHRKCIVKKIFARFSFIDNFQVNFIENGTEKKIPIMKHQIT